MTSTLNDLSDTDFLASGRPDSQRVFRRAIRHSRLVRVVRVAVPITVMLVVGGAVAATWLDPMRALARLPVSVDQVVVSGTKITMAAPKLSGFTRDGRKYDLSARAATQDVTNPDVMEFQDVIAKFEAPDKTKVDLTASTGGYNRKTGLLTLRDNVLLVSSSGYRVRLSEVKVDTGNGAVVSDKPVRVEMLQGTLDAKRLEVLKSGEVLNFDGGVNMTVMMDQPPATPESPAKP